MRARADLLQGHAHHDMRSAAERQAVNTVCQARAVLLVCGKRQAICADASALSAAPQGSAADVIKRAIVMLQRHLAADAARPAALVLSVRARVCCVCFRASACAMLKR
jgi:DNA polymerase I-like protein with 3'-5' exonuclease and polymerase domains